MARGSFETGIFCTTPGTEFSIKVDTETGIAFGEGDARARHSASAWALRGSMDLLTDASIIMLTAVP